MRRTATVLAALAGFVPLPLPPGGDAGIIDFAASGNNWAARTDDPNSLQLTTDAGGSWRTIRLGASPGAGMSVGPDGGFWIPANQGSQRVLVHVTTDGAVMTQPVAASGGLMSPPAWDPAGHM